MRDVYNNITVAEKQRISWMMWYNTHSQEHNEARSRTRDKKRGFVAIDSKYRTRESILESKDTTIKVKPKLSTIEKARLKIARDLAKVEKRRQEWASQQASRQNNKLTELVLYQQESP
jgi:hypothetical protein